MTPTHGMHDPPKESPMALGTVGWNDDGGVFYEAGAADNDGHTLVRVTLYRGRDPSQQKEDGIAQGQKLLCRMGGGFFRVPPRGTQVLVAIPEPFGRSPGASVIVSAMDATSGAPIHGNIKDGEICIGTPGSASRIIMKKNGTMVLFATSDNTTDGTNISLEFGPAGFKVTHTKGAISIDPDGNVTLTSGTAAVTLSAADGAAKLLGTSVAVQGSVAHIGGTLATLVGANAVPPPNPFVPTPLPNSAILGISGLTGIPSTNVFLSP